MALVAVAHRFLAITTLRDVLDRGADFALYAPAPPRANQRKAPTNMIGRPRIRVTRSWVWPAIMGTLVIILVAAGASAAIETHTVTSYWRGLWWSMSLVTTTGFIGAPPRTDGGAALSVFLMVVGFLLLALVSASFAAVFVRDEERPRNSREQLAQDAMVASLRGLEARLASFENQLTGRAAGGVPATVEETDSLPGTKSTP